jgi:hypothetical protein
MADNGAELSVSVAVEKLLSESFESFKAGGQDHRTGRRMLLTPNLSGQHPSPRLADQPALYPAALAHLRADREPTPRESASRGSPSAWPVRRADRMPTMPAGTKADLYDLVSRSTSDSTAGAARIRKARASPAEPSPSWIDSPSGRLDPPVVVVVADASGSPANPTAPRHQQQRPAQVGHRWTPKAAVALAAERVPCGQVGRVCRSTVARWPRGSGLAGLGPPATPRRDRVRADRDPARGIRANPGSRSDTG